MAYNYDEIGKRLRALRKEWGYSLDKLAAFCEVQQYQTISKWETANTIPSIKQLMKLCDLYGCDIGYLLGEYDCKTRKATDIHAETGLSEEAVNELQDRAKACKLENPDIEVLSKLITMTEFWQMIREIRLMISADENYSDSEKNTVYQRNDSVTLTGKRIGDFYRNNAVSSFQYVLKSIRGNNDGNDKA